MSPRVSRKPVRRMLTVSGRRLNILAALVCALIVTTGRAQDASTPAPAQTGSGGPGCSSLLETRAEPEARLAAKRCGVDGERLECSYLAVDFLRPFLLRGLQK